MYISMILSALLFSAEVDLLEKRSNIGAVTNQILMSTDRLGSYFVAEQAHLAKKERDFASTSIDLAKKN